MQYFTKKLLKCHAQLWSEETDCIGDYVKLMPQGGTVLEIGIVQGGSTSSLLKGTQKNNVKLYTVDFSLTKAAYQTLSGTNVNIISEDSACFAKKRKVEDEQNV